MSNVKRRSISYNKKIKFKDDSKIIRNGIVSLVGIALCFTGWGALIGIPMLIWLLFASENSFGGWVGDCPNCQKSIYWLASPETKQGNLSCPICGSFIEVYDGYFHHKPPAIASDSASN